MFYAVIIAGGRGERFWPLSRAARPKQFLGLTGKKTMFRQTVERVAGAVGFDRILVITAGEFSSLVASQAPEIPPENILGEPVGRDTAAAIGLAALEVASRDPEAVLAVLPADHYINREDRFLEVLQGAVEAARGDFLVTLGITPTRPETGYGYILKGDPAGSFGGLGAFRVERFTEKPDLERALEFLGSGRYLWNSGMFVWRAGVILNCIKQYIPELHRGLREIAAAGGCHSNPGVLDRVYPSLPKLSIDYGVMEKAGNTLVIPGDFGWDDVGSWTALEGYLQPDRQGNVLSGRGVLLDTRNTFIHAPGRTVGTIGLTGLIVVVDGDCVLICPKDRAQEIKKITSALQGEGLGEAT